MGYTGVDRGGWGRLANNNEFHPIMPTVLSQAAEGLLQDSETLYSSRMLRS